MDLMELDSAARGTPAAAAAERIEPQPAASAGTFTLPTSADINREDPAAFAALGNQEQQQQQGQEPLQRQQEAAQALAAGHRANQSVDAAATVASRGVNSV